MYARQIVCSVCVSHTGGEEERDKIRQKEGKKTLTENIPWGVEGGGCSTEAF